VGEKELKVFRENERLEMLRIIDDYLRICAQVGVCFFSFDYIVEHWSCYNIRYPVYQVLWEKIHITILQARAENAYIVANSVEEGIVELISQHRIGRLVMGAAVDSRYSRFQYVIVY